MPTPSRASRPPQTLYLVATDGSPISRRAAAAAGLPAYADDFVGRDAELAKLDRLLIEERARLVTVRGSGGMGKTRLVTAWAELALRDGVEVAFVPLASLSSSEHLPTAIAVALGLTVDPKSDPADDVLKTLESRETVLILDNLEPLLFDPGVAKWLQTILDRSSKVRILVTSRERIGLSAETIVELGGLAVDGDGSEAARLFEDRARMVQSDFDAKKHASAIAAICHLLEGVPLGVELAATWVRMLGCDEILGEMKKALDFLIADPRSGRDPRHVSMRAVFSQSWGLLADEEQRALARLSIFRGGFDRAATEKIAGASLGLLAGLVDRSLVRAKKDRSTRYDMHELLRQFAAEKLAELGEAEKIEAAHAEYFVELAQARHPQLRGESQVATLVELTHDLDNLRAAMDYATRHSRWELLAKAGWALWPFWWIRNMQREGRRWMERVMPHVGELDAFWRIQATIAMGAMLYAQGDVAGCVRYSHELIKLSTETNGNPRALAFAYGGFGLGATAKGDRKAALENLAKSRELFLSAGDPGIAAQAAAWLGTFHLLAGDLASAKESASAGLAEAIASGDRLANTSCRYGLARIAIAENDLETAREHLLESIAPSLAIEDQGNLSYVFELLGAVAARVRTFAPAAMMFGASDAILEAIGNRGHTYYMPDVAALKQARKTTLTELGETHHAKAYAEGAGASIDALVAVAKGIELEIASAVPSEPPPTPKIPSKNATASAEVRYFEADDSLFIGHEYIVKGLPGRILWRMLQIRHAEGRDEFTNRELRLDASLKLPELKDNLESRLILLAKRLLEKSAPIRIERPGRGRLRLAVEGELTLTQIGNQARPPGR